MLEESQWGPFVVEGPKEGWRGCLAINLIGSKPEGPPSSLFLPQEYRLNGTLEMENSGGELPTKGEEMAAKKISGGFPL